MTFETSTFPIGYFYIISKLNGMALDIDTSKPVGSGSKVVTAPKKEQKPERDTQLWIHQDGFLTNKFTGLVLDIGKAKTFKAIFTGEEALFVDEMKTEENANDQRFGFSNGYLYPLSEPNNVVDIRKSNAEAGADIIIHVKKEEDAFNQLWELELADPPKVLDSSDDEEDDSKRARLRAWFGNWLGWKDHDKTRLLKEDELQKAHDKVYKKKKSKLPYEIIAGAVAVEAVKHYIAKQEENGEDVRFKGAKEAIAGFAAAEMVKIFMERGTDDDDEDDDEERKQKKQTLLQNMAISAASNYYDTKYK
ncbi:hypothetical protein BCV72DRAFT_261795 [Rhizopus microsporus var. microsporus]|uniref:Ricin B lectin domain-containing protein n=2 Tax=Rhizopus microsporus TaxID=58291 RepID=A0A2G4SXX3_RHIZD|nr:uncharacterized protein RHIMIDRAFT_312769 [Rhizopus microsporus ATCC 52813]ORE07943.1 hypothetical protein BCV72DRAFT_261795 [Rhizopus microsporus var. microsporus]PHZ13619.1 hypothetical protein RHIMIDRAFT_312769 [Rhizopus microsporus ATCC 52813]